MWSSMKGSPLDNAILSCPLTVQDCYAFPHVFYSKFHENFPYF